MLQPQFYDPLGPLSEVEIEERRRHHERYTEQLRNLPEDVLYRYSMGLLRNYAAFVDTDIRDEIGALSMPIDIMHATGDRVVHYETGLQLHASLPQATFHTLDGLGHGLFYYPEGRALARRIIENQVASGGMVAAAAGE